MKRIKRNWKELLILAIPVISLIGVIVYNALTQGIEAVGLLM
jgi:hypothetical protein